MVAVKEMTHFFVLSTGFSLLCSTEAYLFYLRPRSIQPFDSGHYSRRTTYSILAKRSLLAEHSFQTATKSDIDQESVAAVTGGTLIESFELQNWGLFDHTVLTLGSQPLFAVITGETGSGKSVLISALQYLYSSTGIFTDRHYFILTIGSGFTGNGITSS